MALAPAWTKPLVFPAFIAGLNCGLESLANLGYLSEVFPAFIAGLNCGTDDGARSAFFFACSRRSSPGSIAASPPTVIPKTW